MIKCRKPVSLILTLIIIGSLTLNTANAVENDFVFAYEDFDLYENMMLDEWKIEDLNGGTGFEGGWKLDGETDGLRIQENKLCIPENELKIYRKFENAIIYEDDVRYFISTEVKNPDYGNLDASILPERDMDLCYSISLGSETRYSGYTPTVMWGMKYSEEKGGYVPYIEAENETYYSDKILSCKKNGDTSYNYRYFVKIDFKADSADVGLMVVETGKELQRTWDVNCSIDGGFSEEINGFGFEKYSSDTFHAVEPDNIIIEKYNYSELEDLDVKENLTPDDFVSLNDSLARDYYWGKANFNDGKITVMNNIITNEEGREITSSNYIDIENGSPNSVICNKGVFTVVDLKNGTGEESSVKLIFSVMDIKNGKFVKAKAYDIILPSDKYSGKLKFGFTQEELNSFSENGLPGGYVYETFLWDSWLGMKPLITAEKVFIANEADNQ